jgi:hypothetical protein
MASPHFGNSCAAGRDKALFNVYRTWAERLRPSRFAVSSSFRRSSWGSARLIFPQDDLDFMAEKVSLSSTPHQARNPKKYDKLAIGIHNEYLLFFLPT